MPSLAAPKRRSTSEIWSLQKLNYLNFPLCRNLALLSFGEDAAEEDAAPAVVPAKIKSAHDILDEKRLMREEAEGEAAELVRIRQFLCWVKCGRTAFKVQSNGF